MASDFYNVDGFLAGRSTLRGFELAEMGEVVGCSLIHPQCHFGLDTLYWARLGARATGLDFSAPAIEAARTVAAQANIKANFVQATVYDAVHEHDFTLFARWPFLERRPDGTFELPADMPKLPLMYSLRARAAS